MNKLSGSNLKKIRLERNISLERVAAETRIRLSILQDLEDEEYQELASTAQTRGFLRIYAQYLGIESPRNEVAQNHTEASAQVIAPKKMAEDPNPIELAQDTPPVAEEQKPVPPTTEQAEAEPQQLAPDKPRGKVAFMAIFHKLHQKSSSSPNKPDLQTPNKASEIIFANIGAQLAERRRSLNFSWDTIAEHTHLDRSKLQAIEKGDASPFLNVLQYKSSVINYAHFLNADTDKIVDLFAEALQQHRLETSKSTKTKRKKSRVLPNFLVNLKRFFSLDLFLGTILILGILIFLIWGISRMSFETQRVNNLNELPNMADVILASPTYEALSTLAPEATGDAGLMAMPTSTPFYSGVPGDAPVEIYILARQTIWLRIFQDAKKMFEGRMQAGSVLTFSANEQIDLETGNLSGMEIIYAGKTINNPATKLGQSAHLQFTTEGWTIVPVHLPTPNGTVTPTSTQSPLPSLTPSPTQGKP